MKKFLKKRSGAIMLGLGAGILTLDLMGVSGVVTFAIGIILIVEGIDKV